MHFSQWLLLTVPGLVLGVIIVCGGVVLSVSGLLLVRRAVPHHKLKVHNDVAGPIFGTLGVVYAVLLAFVVIIVWESFDKSNLNVEREVGCLTDLYRDAESFAPEFKTRVRKLCLEYARAVVDSEWDNMIVGKSSLDVNAVMKKIWEAYSGYVARNGTEQIFLEESVRRINELSELRMMRILDARNGINPLLWFVLVLGGVATVAFTFFFGTESFHMQLIMTLLLSVIISLVLFTILSLDFPFTGDISVSPEAFKQVLALPGA